MIIGAGSADTDTLDALLRRAGRGDRPAFAELYRRTSSTLFAVCLRMLRDRGEAEDTLQETYIVVWRSAASFDDSKGRAITWLITVARNRSIDRLRRRRDVLVDDEGLIAEVADESPTPAASAESSDAHRRLNECLDALEPQQRSAVRAAFFTGATYNELAARGKVPLGTMKSWIRRSLLQLRGCVDRSGASP